MLSNISRNFQGVQSTSGKMDWNDKFRFENGFDMGSITKAHCKRLFLLWSGFRKWEFWLTISNVVKERKKSFNSIKKILSKTWFFFILNLKVPIWYEKSDRIFNGFYFTICYVYVCVSNCQLHCYIGNRRFHICISNLRRY